MFDRSKSSNISHVLYKPAASVRARWKYPYLPKEVKEYFFPSSFCFYTNTTGKHETWTKHKRLRWTVRFVCFNNWKCTEAVINCQFPATRRKLCYIAKSKQLSNCFAIKTIKHKISRAVYSDVTYMDVFIQIEQSSCTIHRNSAQKGSIRLPKLLLPCNSMHAYSPKQSPIVFLQLLYKFSWLN